MFDSIPKKVSKWNGILERQGQMLMSIFLTSRKWFEGGIVKKWKGIVIHHSETVDNGTLADIEAIRRYHIQHNGWKDIGYHFVIEKVGGEYKVFAGRSLEESGAHALGFNTSHIGICCVGNFDIEEPSEDLYRAARELVAQLIYRYSMSIYNVIGHRDTYVLRNVPVEKTCPGKKFDLGKIIP
ncbi:MAG: peptidoglycan recognition protein family protein [Endomicrobium sp.]|jgi:hypothetical protein|nr:peptidoglycan recognition protein family protein [Endomicrobium sp.]